jgi:hypothetical protein
MKFFIRIVVTYFSCFVAQLIASRLIEGEAMPFLKTSSNWAIPFKIVLLAQVIGYVLNALINKENLKEKVFNFTFLIVFLGFLQKTLSAKSFENPYLRAEELKWSNPLIIVLIGLVFIFILIIINNTTAYAQKATYRICLFIFFVFVSSTTYFIWQHEKKFGNTEANQRYFKYFKGEYANEIKIAFDTLSKTFPNPNSFRIVESIVKPYQTSSDSLDGKKTVIFYTDIMYKIRDKKTIHQAYFSFANSTLRSANIDHKRIN